MEARSSVGVGRIMIWILAAWPYLSLTSANRQECETWSKLFKGGLVDMGSMAGLVFPSILTGTESMNLGEWAMGFQ